MVSKGVVAGALLAVLATAGLIVMGMKQFEDKKIRTEFQQWKLQQGKNYFSQTEDEQKYQNFKQNWYIAQSHNAQYQAGMHTFYLGMTSLADLSNAEYKKLLGTQSYTTNDNVVTLDDNNLKASVNWVTAGAVTGVKNQGSCGSCWAFSTTGSMEGLNYIKNGKLQSFSEQQLVDCSGSYGNQGCNGGLMDDAFKYTEKYGLELEGSYAYEGKDETCSYSKSKEVFANKGYQDVKQNSSSQFMAAIQQQPVSVAIEADSIFFQLYFGGVFSYSGCGTTLDHGVLAVGYGTESSKNYYLVKNSWGSSWGSSGYIKIENNGDGPGVCGIQMQASYPTV